MVSCEGFDGAEFIDVVIPDCEYCPDVHADGCEDDDCEGCS